MAADKTIDELDAGSALDGSEVLPAVQDGDTIKLTSQDIADLAVAVTATVYVHDGSAYQVTGGRIFIGPEDPASDGFTLVDGDQWEDTSA